MAKTSLRGSGFSTVNTEFDRLRAAQQERAAQRSRELREAANARRRVKYAAAKAERLKNNPQGVDPSGKMVLTDAMKAAMRPVWLSRRLSAGIRILSERQDEFDSRLAMNLAGIAMIPDARAAFDQALDSYWNSYIVRLREAKEVIIGSGVTAAGYCAARVLSGFEPPLVLEASDRPGGVFALSHLPAFRLNSPNRPGLGGVPGEQAALNYIPGAPIQLAGLSRAEFQDNTDVAFVVRAMLAMYARVIPGSAVTGLEADGATRNTVTYTYYGAREMIAGRVIDARGTGVPVAECDGKIVLDFNQFMKRMDDPFPLRGMGRVAVIGDGDAAKCVIESLLGISPGLGMTPASLDWVPRIDWYAPKLPDNRDEWKRTQRGRYGCIASYLPPEETFAEKTARLRLFRKTGTPVRSIGCVLVRERTYDMAVMCTGNRLNELNPDFSGAWELYGSPRMCRRIGGTSLLRAGPAADLPFSDQEQTNGVDRRPENAKGMFRYTPKTAALAVSLKDAVVGRP